MADEDDTAWRRPKLPPGSLVRKPSGGAGRDVAPGHVDAGLDVGGSHLQAGGETGIGNFIGDDADGVGDEPSSTTSCASSASVWSAGKPAALISAM